ncbi:MAG: TetR/AcrR family transcriptional regulator [Hominenteromicrobium sp.]
MDLRQKKTLRAIRNAFFQLHARKPLEKITIKELSELAEISKATFYLHYRDIYDLLEQLQKEIVGAIFDRIDHPEWVVTAPADFSRELFMAFQSQKTYTDILFSGTQESVLPKALEQEIRRQIFAQMPALEHDVRFNTLLTFEVQGSYYAYLDVCKRFDCDAVLAELAKIADTLSEYLRTVKK